MTRIIQTGDAPVSVEYVAVVDASYVNPDGSRPETPTLIIDAIPTKVLDRLKSHFEASDIRQAPPTVDFLLLTLQRPTERFLRAAETGEYMTINVSQGGSTDVDGVATFATTLNGRDSNNMIFSVRVSDSIPKPGHIKTLRKLAQFDHIVDAEDLSAFEITNNSGYIAVAVYDVGQASMCAIVDAAEHPLIFFDLGWPVSFNKKSIPDTAKYFSPFSVSRGKAPVVLSHLDWDHWAYAYLSGKAKWDKKIGAWKTEPIYRHGALDRPWLIRRPNFANHKLGPSHIHFIEKLSAKNNLYFWPRKSRCVSLGPISVFACQPAKGTLKTAPFLRNNQGLGMLVEDKTSGARVLLTGDADFPSIPRFAKKRLNGLVAPHHGGKITPGSIPNATGHGRMVFSAFKGCYSNIPHPAVEIEAHKSGWHIERTYEREECFRLTKKIKCGNRLIRLAKTPKCTCDRIPVSCLCISKL